MTTRDAPGVIAAFAGRLDELGCSVVIASTEVVVGQVSIMAIASTQRAPLTTTSIQRSLLDLGLTLRTSVHVVPIPERRSMWPQPGSELYRLRFAIEEQPGAFHEITSRIAAPDVPLWSFSTWVEDGLWCCGDVVVAPSVEVDAYSLGDDLYKALERLGRRRSVSWRHLAEFPPPPKRRSDPREDGVALSVVGFARPGFVCGALGALADRHLSVVGSAMAILGAYTGLLLVVDASHTTDPDELAAAVQERLLEHDQRLEEPFESQVVAWSMEDDPGPRWPVIATHTVRCEATDPMGVLASVAGLLADRDVNIVRARTQFEGAPGARSTCTIELAVAMSPQDGRGRSLQAELAEMASVRNWERAELHQAAPDPDETRISGDSGGRPSLAQWLERLAAMESLEVTVDPVDDIRAMRRSPV